MSLTSVARGSFFGSLLALGRGTRFDDEDVDRFVFGELGESISFLTPDLPPCPVWYGREFGYPDMFEFGSKVSLLGPEGNRTGFLVTNFGREDQGRLYSITTNYVKTNYIATIANRVEADIHATLHITPTSDEISSITWKYTSTSTTKSTDFVEVLDHDTFKSRAGVNATTGKLCVREWRSSDDGFFIAEIDGKPFAEIFKVVSTVRVEPGGDLHLDPHFVGEINQFSWYRDDTLLVEYIFESDRYGRPSGRFAYRFPHCLTVNGTLNGNCNFDSKTGKLTIKFWQHSFDGVFTMMINGEMYQNKIKVVGDVYFAPYLENLQFDPPPFTDDLKSIRWLYGGNLAVDFEEGGEVEYYTLCKDSNINCILNTTTGRLTIWPWYPLDTKRYAMDVNGRKQPCEYLAAGVARLDGYDAKLVAHYVSDTKTILICEGDFDAAEPVKYLWRVRGTTKWVEGTYMMETPHVFVKSGRTIKKYDACKVKNPVSELVITL